MTNSAILTILNNLCNEARDTVHTTLGLIELQHASMQDAALKNYIELSRSSADRLIRSIDDIRDLLSVSPPPQRIADTLDAGQSLTQTVELLNVAASLGEGGGDGGRGSESGVGSNRLRCTVPNAPVEIRQDRHSFEQVLARVLDAALKLTPDSVTTVALEEAGRGVRITVLPAAPLVASDLFEWLNADLSLLTFSERQNVSVAIHVIVAGKRLLALHGMVDAILEADQVVGLALEVPSLSEEDETQSRGESRPERLKILVAEDSDESYVLSEILLQQDHISRAKNGLEAVELVKRQRFDVVLMDVHMPVMDGYAAIREIREWETRTANARTPIVVLSSDDLETQQRSAANAGCSGFLRKPLRNSSLLELRRRLSDTHSPLI